MKTNNTPQNIGVHIKCKDFDKSYRFYKTLEFNEIFAYGPETFLKTLDSKIPTAKENYRGITFGINGAMLEIADGHIAVNPEVFKESINSPKISLFFDIKSIKDLMNICKKAEITIYGKPVTYPWGKTEIVIKDPDGVVLVFRE